MDIRARAADFGGFLDFNTGKVGYLRGTRGQICTNGMVHDASVNPAYKKYWKNIKEYAYKWVGKVTADCAGFYDMFINQGTYQIPITKWKYPDFTADGLFALAKKLKLPYGKISTIPKDCPFPIAVRSAGHVGFFYHGKVYQSASHKMGTIITDLSSTAHNKAWSEWYMIPWLDYEGWVPGGNVSNHEGEEEKHMINILGSGPEVAAVQQALIDLGFKGDMNPELIGTGGQKTKAALIAYQKHRGIPQTGLVDEATQTMMFRDLGKPDPKEIKQLQGQIDLLVARISAAKTALG